MHVGKHVSPLWRDQRELTIWRREITISPLWQREQRELLAEMIDAGVDAVIVKARSPPRYSRDIAEI